jgi:SAM-dependent methyltransferase
VKSSPTSDSSRSPDFGRLAADYDRVRPVDDNWREVFELVVREGDLRGRRVLDCGCGTGRLSQALAESEVAKVWGVDPEPEMLRVAAGNVPPSVGLKAGRAEDLPFRDGWFERAVLWLVCHLVDRPVAFRELHRVLASDGRLAIVTFDPTHFGSFWLDPYFPSIQRIDRDRFPDAAELEAQLVEGGFSDVQFHRRSQRAAITREQALERIEQRHISTFDLLDPEEVARGTRLALDQLPPTVEYAIEWLVVVGQC